MADLARAATGPGGVRRRRRQQCARHARRRDLFRARARDGLFPGSGTACPTIARRRRMRVSSDRLAALAALAAPTDQGPAARHHGQCDAAANAATRAHRRADRRHQARRPDRPRQARGDADRQRLRPHRHRARGGRICRPRRLARPVPGPGRAPRCGSTSSATRSKPSAASIPRRSGRSRRRRASSCCRSTRCCLDDTTIKAFRAGYLREFGATATGDPLYEAMSDGRRLAGMEHWLPLFEPGLATLFDYLGPGAVIVREAGTDKAAEARLEAIADYFDNRKGGAERQEGQLPPAADRRPVPVARRVERAARRSAGAPDVTVQRSPTGRAGRSTARQRRRATSPPNAPRSRTSTRRSRRTSTTCARPSAGSSSPATRTARATG